MLVRANWKKAENDFRSVNRIGHGPRIMDQVKLNDGSWIPDINCKLKPLTELEIG